MLGWITGALCGVSWFANPYFWNVIGRAVGWIADTLGVGGSCCEEKDGEYELIESRASSETISDVESEELRDEIELEMAGRRRKRAQWVRRVKMIAALGAVGVLFTIRPNSPIYGHLTGTLPFTIVGDLLMRMGEFCDMGIADGMMGREFPVPEWMDREALVISDGKWKGWTPGKKWWEVERKRPAWLPKRWGENEGFGGWDGTTFERERNRTLYPPPPPHGREYPHHPHHSGPHHGPHPPKSPHHHESPQPKGYDSILDPLKISNADEPVLAEIKEKLKKGKVPIKHVVILSLESTRKDVFPLVKDSELGVHLTSSRKHSKISDSYGDLADVSPTAEALTGVDGGWGRPPSTNFTFSGINIQSATTGATFTLKSLLGSHCGVSPLPVDFAEELDSTIYQPCLPQILNLFNTLPKPKKSSLSQKHTFLSSNWSSHFMQSVTGNFDRQTPLMAKMGFTTITMKENLIGPSSPHPAKEPEVNYFGFPEPTLIPYLRDLFHNAVTSNTRLFLSHITSTSHHPWSTPGSFGSQKQYFGREAPDERGDRYLNSIRYDDAWVATFLSLLREAGMEDETLVVLVGDHGFSFTEESTIKTAYANADISNFRVPMLFRHPALSPGLQLKDVTVTSTSILPTILDLLELSGSLPTEAEKVAGDLRREYEGQSLVRQFVPEVVMHKGTKNETTREALNFGVVNPGGTHFSITGAASGFRLVIPICEKAEYVFEVIGDGKDDAGMKKRAVRSWEGGRKLRRAVEVSYGVGSRQGEWVERVEKVAGWMVWELRRRWGYWEGGRAEDRGGGKEGAGVLTREHWWST